jgi:BMFP domain-containing protein YqiC
MISVLAKNILRNAVQHLPSFNTDNNAQMQALHSALQEQLETALKKANLISRTEFDIQTDVLHRTQAHVATLEEQLTLLEKKLKDNDD